MALRRAKTKRTTPELPTMRELMQRRGLSVAELAERSGYTAEHIRRVMRGDHPGSRKFHAFMESMLGGKYRAGGQLAFDDSWLPRGVRGNNDFETIVKVQGFTGPQPWPTRPPEIDDEAMDALIREIEKMRRMNRERAAKRAD